MTNRIAASATLAGLVVAWLLATGLVSVTIPAGFDARIWYATDPLDPYTHATYAQGELGYFYSPAFAQAMALLNWLPWDAFLVVWGSVMALAFVAMAGPWTLLLLAVPYGILGLLSGNAELLILLAAVVGFRHPWAWAFPLLTKVTPGVGLLWFVVRGEWRSLAIALGATAGIVAASAALAPHLWVEWVGLLAANSGTLPPLAIPLPLLPRLVAAAVLVVWGARTDRPQTVVVAAWLAQPVLWGYGVIVALPLFLAREHRARVRVAAEPRHRDDGVHRPASLDVGRIRPSV